MLTIPSLDTGKRKPDFANLEAVLSGERPQRPVLFEFIIDPTVMLLGEPMPEDPDSAIAQFFKAYHKCGYDAAVLPFWLTDFMDFEKGRRHSGSSISQNEGGLISDEESFDSYPWPNPDRGSYHRIPEYAALLPDGMKMGIMCPGGVLENMTDLLGFENMCYMLADEPELLQRVADAIGSRLLRY